MTVTLRFVILSLLVSELNAVGQNKSSDVSDFMEVVIKELKLNKSFGLSSKPDTSLYEYPLSDKVFLSKFLIDSAYIESRRVYDSIQNSRPAYEIPTIDPDITPNKYLTYSDLEELVLNDRKKTSFKWRTGKLRFSTNNKKEWYSFSIPIFNKDKSKAVIKVVYTCSSIFCGSGDIFLFQKNNDQNWTYRILRHWDN